MAYTRGIDVGIYANTGTDVAPVWTFVGGQKNATLHEENDTVEVTNKGSVGGMKEYDYGFGGWTVSCDGLLVEDDAGFLALQTAMRNKTKIKVRVKRNAAYTEEGLALITSRDLEAPHDDDTTYSVELQGTGALTPNPV